MGTLPEEFRESEERAETMSTHRLAVLWSTATDEEIRSISTPELKILVLMCLKLRDADVVTFKTELSSKLDENGKPKLAPE